MSAARVAATLLPRIQVRQAHEPPSSTDGQRFLVDRRWPPGLTKDAGQVDVWLKDVAPSAELRQWFAHDPVKWPEFDQRYRHELTSRPRALAPLLRAARDGPITLVFGADDEGRDEAMVLRDVLIMRLELEAAAVPRDPVGEASYESFPASDAPSWATGQARQT